MNAFPKQLAKRLTFKPFKAKKERDQFGFETYNQETRDQISPGAVLRMKNGSIQIVGDCNQLFGVCDDCVEYGYEDVKEIAHIDQLLKKKGK